MKYIIGIDAGTSNVKAVLFDVDGAEVLVESLENEPIYIGDTEVEQNMNILWEKVALCIKMLMENGPASPDDILGIGVTAQGEGIWLIDEKGEPVQDAILWCDGRSADEIQKWIDDGQAYQDIYNVTGANPMTGAQLSILKWMKENRKDVLDRSATMFFCKDWVRYKLTGKIATDASDASTSVMDLENETVATELLERLGLGEYARLIPTIDQSNSIAGEVTEEVAKSLGLNPGTPVITGAIDVIASAVGIGAVEDKDICVILGTTCANEIFMKKEDCEFGKEGTFMVKHAVGDLYVNLQPTMNGTPNIDWVLNEIALTKDFAKIDLMIKDVPAGSGGVIYHPYISAAGERAPFYHPNAKANFFGISANTRRADLVHAVYEGITLSIKDCLQGADKTSKIFIAGGGAKSSIWAQMISDVTGMEVVVSAGNEFGAKGAAMMLGTAVGVYESYKDAAERTCKAERIYRPRPDQNAIYEEIYKLYKGIRIACEDLWTARAEVMKTISKRSRAN